ncbi:hypothetical protein QBZ16_003166 [Prototheca wickerhamii]|uniref:Uncharacterized protein n=1 Tax=Prototheca wickerhamii TaxID=3111 RepID=A0AAD9IJ36_PROWI|nr:hypothetical protein QBZ16_003166 [Prototheca wickerhamii]
MDPNFLQQLMQDPTIQRMTEAIASDPGFMDIAKEMQESMMAGMGGLNLNDEEAEAAAPGGFPGGFPGGMPNIDPTKYMSAMQRIMGNPEFVAAAESLGKSLMTQAVDPEMALLMDLFSNPAHAELLKSKLDELKSDDELKPVLEEIESGGQEAMMKYMTDTEVMSKLGKKFQELLKDPEFKARSLASAGDVAGLKELLAQEGASPDVKDEEGRTPLHFAAGYGEIECMEALMDAGANVNAVDDNDNTALHYAAGYGNIEVARILVNKGKADLSIKNSEGKTADEVAELNEQTELVALLRAN